MRNTNLPILNLNEHQKDILTDLAEKLKPYTERILDDWLAAYNRQHPETGETLLLELKFMGYAFVSTSNQTGWEQAYFDRLRSVSARLTQKNLPFTSLAYGIYLLQERYQQSLNRVYQDHEDLREALVAMSLLGHVCLTAAALPYVKERTSVKTEHPPSNHGLTHREIEILKLIVEGYRSREIAKILKLSVKTIEHHRASIQKKLGVSNVVQLVRFAIEKGMTD